MLLQKLKNNLRVFTLSILASALLVFLGYFFAGHTGLTVAGIIVLLFFSTGGF